MPPVDTPPKQRMFFRWLMARLVFLPTLAWNYLLGRVIGVREWWNEVDEDVIIGAYPFSWDVEAIKEEGVGAVVNTCEEYAGPVAKYQALDIHQFHMPTVDFTSPSLADCTAAVEFMQQQIADGRRIYVHCKAGRGRSATVVMCWLIATHDMTPEDAQTYLLTKRPHAHKHLFKRKAVRDYFDIRNSEKQACETQQCETPE